MAERHVKAAFAPAVTAAAAGATTDAVLRTTTSGASRAVPGGFRRGQKILLVGEGNFSFSLALALALGSGDDIVATAFDTFRQAREKYPTALETNVAVLQRLGCRPLFGVDATRLAADPAAANALLEAQTGEASASARLPVFDRIVFNFPHTGGATTADVKRNQSLLRGFLEQASLLLRTRSPGPAGHAGEEARVLVALRRTPFYESWRCDVQGQACRLDYRGKNPFVAAHFPGYAPTTFACIANAAGAPDGLVAQFAQYVTDNVTDKLVMEYM